MAQPKVKLYVDIVSPFAYIAFHLLENSPVFKGCEITYVPILLGGLMHACGNKAPITIKNKDTWINTERIRWCTYFDIPISTSAPPGFPINTLSIQRSLVSLSLSHPQCLPRALSLFWDNFWVHWNEPTKPENLQAIIRTAVNSEDEVMRVLEKTKGEEVKKLLGANTDAAFRGGAFGLPWFVATNAKGETESYWGVDHMGQMCDHLGLEKPTTKGWKALL